MSIAHLTGLESGQIKTLFNGLIDDINDADNAIIATIDASPSVRSVTTLANLDAISDAIAGDLVTTTTPATGVQPITWVAVSGSGSGIDWVPLAPIVSDTLAHLDSLVSAVAAIADTRFVVGGIAVVTGTNTYYEFTSTAGAYRVMPAGARVPIICSSVTAAAGTVAQSAVTGVITLTAATTLNGLGSFSTVFRNYVLEVDAPTLGTPAGIWTFQIGAGSAVASAYDTQRIYFADAGAAGPARTTNAAAWDLNGSNGPHTLEARIKGPFLAAATQLMFDMGSFATAGGVISNVIGRGQHRTATSYTSFHLVFGGAVTGEARLYGII